MNVLRHHLTAGLKHGCCEYSNEEPGARKPHVGNCAGVSEQFAHPAVTATYGL